ncbi:hypothetical protein [Methylocaldum marinum]|uniref:hypothetical protein n=1 Tax=Methylocaldum marinum TaxID=1432792 RepID=UPI000E679C8B|nr:hypothetical protein [Methylocaldum marinum]
MLDSVSPHVHHSDAIGKIAPRISDPPKRKMKIFNVARHTRPYFDAFNRFRGSGRMKASGHACSGQAEEPRLLIR